MRKFTITIFSLVVMAAVAVIFQKEDDPKPLPDLLERMINEAPMNSYQDKIYGYTVRYPSFFEQLPDSLINEAGCCRFRFWNWVDIEQTVYVLPNPDSLTVRQGMDCLANALHATDARCDVNSFILSGPLYIDNSQISGHRFYAKYVQHRKIWFVQSLTYPEECSLAVEKLIRQIENWSVWEEDRPRVPEIHFRRPQTTAHRSTRYTALPQ
ncbi:MAG: hypothetical protein IJ155_04810 [Prevotella sp.]|nr:hypothetical protein [Prevotella sp.]